MEMISIDLQNGQEISIKAEGNHRTDILRYRNDNGFLRQTKDFTAYHPNDPDNSDYVKSCTDCKHEFYHARCLMCSRNFKDEYESADFT